MFVRSQQSLNRQQLITASKCALPKLVQLCIDYIVSQTLPVQMGLLTCLDPSHAGELLVAMHKENEEAFLGKGKLSTATAGSAQPAVR
jgi:hypothetical protein